MMDFYEVLSPTVDQLCRGRDIPAPDAAGDCDGVEPGHNYRVLSPGGPMVLALDTCLHSDRGHNQIVTSVLISR